MKNTVKNTTMNIEKGKEWIRKACKTGADCFFRFVSPDRYGHLLYTEWETAENAVLDMKGCNEYNTFQIQKLTFEA